MITAFSLPLALPACAAGGWLTKATVRLTVATTTRDRRECVLRALESIAPQLRSGDELIVVDNGSTDGTDAAVRSWIEAHCPVTKLIVEPTGGTSQARNTAISASSAPIVCFVDDDASKIGRSLHDIPVLSLPDAVERFPTAMIAAGIGKPSAREAVTTRAVRFGMRPASLVHPRVERNDGA